jgi:hypothetical protein
MSWRARVEAWLAGRRTGRITGFPTSSNGASSMHLSWVMPPGAGPLVAVAATLTIVEAPVVPRLYFWAIQASFGDRGQHLGAAHLGLQWHPEHPGSTAANWGGYAAAGGELRGTESPLPSARGNPNTRDFTWIAGHPYRLRIGAADGGAWAGAIDGTEIRRLLAGGTELSAVVVWSEVFARCDDPTVVVRWSDFEAITAAGDTVRPVAVRTNYQTHANGGCANTTARRDGDGIVQITNTGREIDPGVELGLL